MCTVIQIIAFTTECPVGFMQHGDSCYRYDQLALVSRLTDGQAWQYGGAVSVKSAREFSHITHYVCKP